MLNENLEEKIKELTNKILDAKDYISSDFCSNCIQIYKDISIWEQQLQKLKNERT